MKKEKFKSLIERNKWLKAVPNSLTLCNSLCGFAAILYTLRVYERSCESSNLAIFAFGAWMILFAMVFDALDGFAARIFNAASMHGIQMDSLADMVTFGVAPATVVAIMTHSLRETMNPSQELMVYFLCSVYLGCAALRLATYNVHAILNKKSGDKFSGLPSPGAAAAICSVVLFAQQHAAADFSRLVFALPVYAAVLGLLMVSRVPYTHFGKWLISIRRNPRRLFLFVIMALSLFIFRADALFVLVTLYILSGPVFALFGAFRRKGGAVQEKEAL